MAPAEPPRDRAPLGAPPPEYRPTRSYDGGSSDTSMRNLALAAVGIAVVVMGGVWALSGHHHQGVPVIEPDATPLRVKPANPGGMQVAGSDDAMLNDSNGTEADKLAPPPETPDTAVLQRQAQTPAPAAAPPVPPPVAAPAVPPQLVPPPVAVPAPAVPAPRTAPEAKPPVAASPPATGHVQVQLGSLDSEADARAEWQRLSHHMPELLSGRAPAVTQFSRDGKVFWRLRTGGFADIAVATQFCGQVRAKGGSCTIASF